MASSSSWPPMVQLPLVAAISLKSFTPVPLKAKAMVVFDRTTLHPLVLCRFSSLHLLACSTSHSSWHRGSAPSLHRLQVNCVCKTWELGPVQEFYCFCYVSRLLCLPQSILLSLWAPLLLNSQMYGLKILEFFVMWGLNCPCSKCINHKSSKILLVYLWLSFLEFLTVLELYIFFLYIWG